MIQTKVSIFAMFETNVRRKDMKFIFKLQKYKVKNGTEGIIGPEEVAKQRGGCEVPWM